MYADDKNFLIVFVFGVVVFFIGFVIFLGAPGLLVFSIFDIIPSLVLGKLPGDVLSTIGIMFSATWPLVVIASFLLSKAKFGKFNKNIVLNKFNLPWFFAFLAIGTLVLTIIFHLIFL